MSTAKWQNIAGPKNFFRPGQKLLKRIVVFCGRSEINFPLDRTADFTGKSFSEALILALTNP